jgi:hypothetical protein
MITRRKPLKRSWLKRKTQYKSDEQTNPYSRYWKRKAMEAFWEYFRGQPCVNCGKKNGTSGHHILHVSTHPHLCAEIRNGVPLCFRCHRLHHDGFLEGLITTIAQKYPEKLQFYIENATSGGCCRRNWQEIAGNIGTLTQALPKGYEPYEDDEPA